MRGLILATATHVKAAVSQKELAAEKIEQAKETLRYPYNEKVVTLVMDYCQNLELPHVGESKWVTPTTIAPLSYIVLE